MPTVRVPLPRFGGWIQADLMAERVIVGDRLMPSSAVVHLAGAGGQPALDLELVVIGGIPRCQRCIVSAVDGGREVRSSDLRAVRIEDWMEEAFAALAWAVVDESSAEWRVDDQSLRDGRRAVQTARRSGRRKITDEFLREVAVVYRANLDDRPVEAVRRAFGGSYRTAASYIERARRTDPPILPPTDKGQRKG